MKKFLLVYYAPKEMLGEMDEKSEEEMKKGMEPWMKWADNMGKQLTDFGNPLGNVKKVTKDGVSEGNGEAAGYSIIEASNMDEALEKVKMHPHLDWGDNVWLEVYETFPVPGM